MTMPGAEPVLVCHPNGTWERCSLKRWGEILHAHVEQIMNHPPRRSALVTGVRPKTNWQRFS